jgi:hypothetical protein
MNEATQYYIGTGAKNCFYTLRYRFSEPVYQRSETGVECVGSTERDYHVRNLSTDREEAISKAREIIGAGLSAEFEVCDITRRSEIDWSVFQAGKYTGKSIHEVVELDRDYLVWACENLKTSKAYGKTVELASALVAHDLAQRAQGRAETAATEQTARQERAAAASRVIEVLKAQNGSFCRSMAEALAKGETLRGRAHSIVLDVYAKAHGRRNSKAYNEAYEQAWQILPEGGAQ